MDEKKTKTRNWLLSLDFDKWYPEKTDLHTDHVEIIKSLIIDENMYLFEFNNNFSKIRKHNIYGYGSFEKTK